MKRVYPIAAAVLSALLTFSGCYGGNLPAGTVREKDITTASEAETQAPPETTAPESAPETTASPTSTGTTAPQAAEKVSEGYREYVIPNTYGSIDGKAFEIFEKAFYGTWTRTDPDGRTHEQTFTYTEDPFAFENWCYPQKITETDELYVIDYVAGGCPMYYIIEKSAPDILYGGIEPKSMDSGTVTVRVNENNGYTRIRNDETAVFPDSGRISLLGLYRLENEYGEDFRRVFDETIEKHCDEGLLDEADGRLWSAGSDMTLDYLAEMYLIERDEDTVVLGRTYLDKEQREKHLQDFYEKEPDVKTFSLTFSRNSDGEWSFSGSGPFSPTEGTDSLEEDYKRVFRENLLGVWHCRETGQYVVIGINENYPDSEKCFGGTDCPVSIKKDREKIELYLRNYIDDHSKAEIYSDKPDELILTDLYEYSDGQKRVEHFDRIDTADMYPETGKLNFYIQTFLSCRGLGDFSPFFTLVYDEKHYVNHYMDAPITDNELTLIEDNGDSIVFSSLFYSDGDKTGESIKRFKFVLHRTDEGWKVREYEPI